MFEDDPDLETTRVSPTPPTTPTTQDDEEERLRKARFQKLPRPDQDHRRPAAAAGSAAAEAGLSPTPPTFAQLCVIVREQMDADPTAGEAEWAERIKHRLLEVGFDYPASPQQLTAAMEAIAHVLEKARRK